MKVLLLQPEDGPEAIARGRWDLVVDLARAPRASYERWSAQYGCRVISLYDFAEEIHDLERTRNLLQLGMGRLVDEAGVDWWDVLSLLVASELQLVLLAQRLTKELGSSPDLYASGRSATVDATQTLLAQTVTYTNSNRSALFRGARRRLRAFAELDTTQLAQVLQDKFDSNHVIRRRIARRHQGNGHDVILLPTAYVNVTRAAMALAARLPERHFLLVWARASARVPSMPANVTGCSLDAYFLAERSEETGTLLSGWTGLKKTLMDASPEMRVAAASGILDSITVRLRWGLGVRNAWLGVLDSENISGCICADDSNPYSRLPLILAKNRGLPTLACHHGALDFRMAIKRQHADHYLAKSPMERDYLRRVCRLSADQVVDYGAGGAASSGDTSSDAEQAASKSWMVFFTEPYAVQGWRREEVYRDFLPELLRVAGRCGLKLVFKLHPFESVNGHRRMLRRLLGHKECLRIRIIGGAPEPQVWKNTRVALTVQSSVALECAMRRIPVFLCGWLRDPYTGYVPQFARFGVGRVLESAREMDAIPSSLAHHEIPDGEACSFASDPEILRAVLAGNWALPRAAGA